MEQSNKTPRKKFLPVILGIIILASVGFGVSKFVYAQHHEDTDDAQVDGDISPVVSRVTGYVSDIRFEDNQVVQKGDTLVTIDSREFMLKVEQAEAAIMNAKAAGAAADAAVQTALSNVSVAQANVAAARVRVQKATKDYDRYNNLIAANSVTRQQFDNVKAEKESAEAALTGATQQVQVAQKQVEAARQQIAVAAASVKQREADLHFAQLQTSYCSITAPAEGRASKKNVQPGQLINAGSPVCAIVADSGVYVIANFKETQLVKMKEGQEAEVVVDAFPGSPIKGSLYRFSAATGAKFSLLPPDNATGNFVKVVQRVPVKIKLTGDAALLDRLRPGMSVKVSVDIN